MGGWAGAVVVVVVGGIPWEAWEATYIPIYRVLPPYPLPFCSPSWLGSSPSLCPGNSSSQHFPLPVGLNLPSMPPCCSSHVPCCLVPCNFPTPFCLGSYAFLLPWTGQQPCPAATSCALHTTCPPPQTGQHTFVGQVTSQLCHTGNLSGRLTTCSSGFYILNSTTI